jgi:hypothetical protein
MVLNPVSSPFPDAICAWNREVNAKANELKLKNRPVEDIFTTAELGVAPARQFGIS